MKKNKYVPDIYKKDIFDIDYNKLWDKKIKCLLFDIDNTLAIVDSNKVSNDTIELINNLKSRFKIIAVSNNFKKRASLICDLLEVDYMPFCIKPLSWKLRRIEKKYNYSNSEICLIGDQVVSDILGGNRLGYMTILVDPISNKDLKITKINRYLEKIIFKKLSKNNGIKRGNYYE